MRMSRLSGLVIAAAGAAVLAFSLYWGADRGMQALFTYRIGMPGVLLLGMMGLIGVVFGTHLVVAPASSNGRSNLPPRRNA